MKLTLEHLAPYLPYELNFIAETNRWQLTSISTVDEYPVWAQNRWDEVDLTFKPSINVKFGDLGRGFKLIDIKLILRPLSDFTKEIEHNGERFVPIDYHAFKTDKAHLIEYQNKFAHFKSVKYGILERLFEWHFDVFGLIDQNLAIDINNIKQ